MEGNRSAPPPPLRVLVADSHVLVRRGLCELLEADGKITVSAEACDGVEAVSLACETHPAVAILDTWLPSISGVEAARRIKATGLGIGVLILAVWDDAVYGTALLRAGVDHYILKSADGDAIVQTVMEIARHVGPRDIDATEIDAPNYLPRNPPQCRCRAPVTVPQYIMGSHDQ